MIDTTDKQRALDLVTGLRRKTQEKLVLLIELHRSLVHKQLEAQHDGHVSVHDLQAAFLKYECSDMDLHAARVAAGLL
jgi:hypothetical protein